MRRQQKVKTPTYNYTEAQLKAAINEGVKKEVEIIRQKAFEEGVGKALSLMLILPMEVLMDKYWPKSYQKKIPQFVSDVLDYYYMWQNDELDMDKLKEDLWLYGNVKIEYLENGEKEVIKNE